MRLAAWALTAAALAGCATAPPGAVPAASSDTLAGRMTVQVEATPTTQPRSVTATFDLQGTPQQGRLDMSTPLGTVLAQARWAPGRVALVTSQGETRFASLDELTREVLGESVPVAALFDWLRGRPWPGAPSTSSAAGEPGFQQLGWAVSLARFDEGWISARRDMAPKVTVRAKLDRP
ncbi:MAG TPA: outer membrane lipoprotein LolB [Albitalea sp.]|uniref:outer membrane lipoprotein LolB n=1 Tax=Piscinibacter sp. TaxID=1903157 RepID=UPI002ED20956